MEKKPNKEVTPEIVQYIKDILIRQYCDQNGVEAYAVKLKMDEAKKQRMDAE